MSELSVGKEVLSHCNKCKHTLAHIIVTMAGPVNIDKVQCKTCQGTHKHKDPDSITPRKTKKAKKTKKQRAEEDVANLWEQAIKNSAGKNRSYSPKGNFEIGDVIDHPKFGQGVIDKLIDRNKIQVIFKADVKTLMHNLS